MTAKLTKHQKWALEHLTRVLARAGTTLDGEQWASVQDTGSPSAMEHLVRKGYAERKDVLGPRGGTLRHYRPKLANGAVAAPPPIRMTTGEIDTRLIEARRSQTAVVVDFVFAGKVTVARGVPGPVERADEVLKVSVGGWDVPLASITRVGE